MAGRKNHGNDHPSLTDPCPPEARLVFADVPWDNYEAMLQIVGERRIRVTYDQGAMEVSMPSQWHEQAAQLLGLFVTRG